MPYDYPEPEWDDRPEWQQWLDQKLGWRWSLKSIRVYRDGRPIKTGWRVAISLNLIQWDFSRNYGIWHFELDVYPWRDRRVHPDDRASLLRVIAEKTPRQTRLRILKRPTGEERLIDCRYEYEMKDVVSWIWPRG